MRYRSTESFYRQAEIIKKTVIAPRKPNFVPISGYPGTGDDHSSADAGCPTSPATYPEVRTGSPQTLPYSVLHRVGFTEPLGSLRMLVRSYRTVSPLPDCSGGLLSVALSFALPRLHVMKHPALRCSDFPLKS